MLRKQAAVEQFCLLQDTEVVADQGILLVQVDKAEVGTLQVAGQDGKRGGYFGCRRYFSYGRCLCYGKYLCYGRYLCYGKYLGYGRCLCYRRCAIGCERSTISCGKHTVLRRRHSANQLQQGGLAAAVVPFDADAVAASQLEVERAFPKEMPGVRIAEIEFRCRDQRLAFVQGGGAEIGFQLLGKRKGVPDALHLLLQLACFLVLCAFQPAGAGLRFVFQDAHHDARYAIFDGRFLAAYVLLRFLFGDVAGGFPGKAEGFLFLLQLFLQGVEADALLLFEKVIVSAVKGQPVGGQFADGGQEIQQCAVVADDEEGGGSTLHKLVQPFPAPRVQVVRRLVQQDGIGSVQLHACQKQAGLFSAAEAVQRACEGSAIHSPCRQGSVYALFEGPVVGKCGEMCFGGISVQDAVQGFQFAVYP